LRAYPEEYQRMLSVIQDYGFDLLMCEQDLFDIDHCEAGRYILEGWDLPTELQKVAAFHHQQPRTGTPELVTVGYCGWQIADMLGYSPFDLRSAATIEAITATLPEAARRRIFAGLDELAEIVKQKVDIGEFTQV
jgi:HD-like signal output (HDOD) protein